jgi:serine/threonine-protein kinase 24/25/MST4
MFEMSGSLDPTVQYELLERIGGGAFGEVYKGIDIQSDEVVAVKIIDLESAADEIEDVQQVRSTAVSRSWWLGRLTSSLSLSSRLLYNVEQEIHVLSQCSCDQLTTYSGSFIAGTKLWSVVWAYFRAGGGCMC